MWPARAASGRAKRGPENGARVHEHWCLNRRSIFGFCKARRSLRAQVWPEKTEPRSTASGKISASRCGLFRARDQKIFPRVDEENFLRTPETHASTAPCVSMFRSGQRCTPTHWRNGSQMIVNCALFRAKFAAATPRRRVCASAHFYPFRKRRRRNNTLPAALPRCCAAKVFLSW